MLGTEPEQKPQVLLTRAFSSPMSVVSWDCACGMHVHLCLWGLEKDLLFLCMSAFPASLCAWCLRKRERDIRCPRTGIRGGCESPWVFWKSNLGCLKKTSYLNCWASSSYSLSFLKPSPLAQGVLELFVAKVGLELRDVPASISQVLGLQASTMPSLFSAGIINLGLSLDKLSFILSSDLFRSFLSFSCL